MLRMTFVKCEVKYKKKYYALFLRTIQSVYRHALSNTLNLNHYVQFPVAFILIHKIFNEMKYLYMY